MGEATRGVGAARQNARFYEKRKEGTSPAHVKEKKDDFFFLCQRFAIGYMTLING